MLYREFWQDKVFDAGLEIEHYAYRPVYKISKLKKASKYEDIRRIASNNN